MLCPSCGQPIRLGSRLCTSCGTWLLEDDARASEQSRATPPPPRQAPPASSLWAPPRAADRVDEPPPAGMGGFGAGGFSAPIVNDIDEHTTLSARRSKPTYWTLSMPNGAVELVTDRAIVVGREPQFMPALPQARLIPVPDPTRSVSKNHACFSLYGATLVVEDLGSTNGVIVTRPNGREDDIGVGGRTELEAGSRVELGDTVINIGRA